jgi:xylulokinase
MTDLTVGLDVGTSSTKAVAVRPDGSVVATQVAAHGVDHPRSGWFEQDAGAVWWDQSADVLSELMRDPAVDPAAVRAVAVSGMGPCVVLADCDGRTLTPGVLYGIDSRASVEIEELARELGAAEVLARTGSPLTSQAIGPKLRWLQRHHPDAWARAREWYGPAGLMVRKLTGRYVIDHHTASQCVPLYDLERGSWAWDWVEQVAPALPMPELASADHIVGEVTAVAAERTGLRAGTPVLAGTIDAWAEAHSVGVRRPGELMVMYGSTMFLIGVVEAGRGHPGLWLTAGLTAGSRTLAAGLATSGLLADWIARTTGQDIDTLAESSGRVAPGADGLLMLPFFAGERSPLFDPDARGVIVGLELRHGPAHLLRAAYEGIAMGVRHNVELFDAFGGIGGHRWRAVAVGGGTKAKVWAQIVSDVTGLPQEVPTVTVGAAYGNAQLAATAVGLVGPDTDWVTTADLIQPRSKVRGLYDERYAAYRELYQATRPLIERLRSSAPEWKRPPDPDAG